MSHACHRWPSLQEPAKYVAKLRTLKADSNMLLLKCDMGAGHFRQSGRFDRLTDIALEHAFLLKSCGMLGTPLIPSGPELGCYSELQPPPLVVTVTSSSNTVRVKTRRDGALQRLTTIRQRCAAYSLHLPFHKSSGALRRG